MIEIVNVVGSGELSTELDLEQVTKDLGTNAKYDPEKYPAMYLHMAEDAPLITLYRTGKYIITGADSEEEAFASRERFLSRLSDQNVIEKPADEWFSIQNIVFTAELPEQVNLNAIAIGLGLEQTEYEPEQFPGLIYRPTNFPCVLLVFATGKVVITGCSDTEVSEKAFSHLRNEIARVVGTES